MAIFRGTGGAGDSTDDSIVSEVTEQAGIATTKAQEAATSATNASNSASSASSSETAASNSATAAAGSASTATTKASEAASHASDALASKNAAATSAIAAADSATAANSANVQTVAGLSTEITNLNGIRTDITGVNAVRADVVTVSGISSDVTTVAADASDIGTVATNITNVNNVGDNISNVNAVHSNASNINTVAADGSDIGTVAGNISNVNTVAGISSDVTTVAGLESKMDAVIADASDIGAVAGNIGNVNTVAGDSSDINTVAGISADVTSVADNMTDVQNADTNAANAATSASNASDSASAASTSAGSASSSASSASTSATSAGNSATTASNSATAASASKDAAASSASAASGSASAAASSASAASTSASNADTSETNAASSASAAATSASDASSSASQIIDLTVDTGAAGSEASYDSGSGVLTVPRGDTGSVTLNSVSGNLTFGDNDKATFGASDDLQIYHDGSNSYVHDNGTGRLFLKANDGVWIRGNNNSTLGKFTQGGAVTLYHNNAQKLATTSTGIDVTGTATMDGLSVDGGAGSSLVTTLKGGTSSQLIIQGDADNIGDSGELDAKLTFASDGGVAGWDIAASNGSGSSTLQFLQNNKKYLNISSGGDISFYEDTGTTPKLFWDASAESLGIGTSSPDTQLHVSKSSVSGTSYDSNDLLTLENNGFTAINMISSASTASTLIFSDTTRAVGYLQYNHSDNSLRTNVNGSERMRIDSSGNVLVGGTSATYNASGRSNVEISGASSALLSLSSGSDDSYFYQSGTGLNIFNTANGYLRFATNDTEAMRITSAGNVGVGTGSPRSDANTKNFSIESSGSTARLLLNNTSTNGKEWGLYSSASGNLGFYNYSDSSEAMRIDSSGRLGIGTSSPSSYDGNADNLVIGGDSAVGLTLASSATNGRGSIYFADGTSGDQKYRGTVNYFHDSDALTITTAAAERMRIDSSGHLLVGKTSASKDTVGAELKADGRINATMSSGSPLLANRKTSDGDIATFQKDGSTVGSIGANAGRIYIGSGNSGLRFDYSAGNAVVPSDQSGNLYNGGVDLGATAAKFQDLYLSGTANVGGNIVSSANNFIYSHNGGASAGTVRSGFKLEGSSNTLAFYTNAAEKARIDSSGNLLVGTTSTANNTDGIRLLNAGYISIAQDSNNVPCGFFNKITHDGNILEFQKDGTSVGSIGTVFGSLTAGTGATGLRFTDGDTSIRPWNLTTNAVIDNTINLGAPAGGFKDLYLSGGVYLGGTGAANKLDDYETGTWTPIFADASTGGNVATVGASLGSYTKVGNLVTVGCIISDIDITGMTSGNAIFIRGLPFATGSTQIRSGSAFLDRVTFSGYVTAYATGSHVFLFNTSTGAFDAALLVSSIDGVGSDVSFTVQYQV